MGKGFLAFATAVSALVAPIAASAATITVNATGTVANTTTNSFTFNGSTYNTGELILDPITPFTVAVGDQILFNLTLDGVFVVPASGEQLFGVNFFNFATTPYGSPAVASNFGTVTFSLMGGGTSRTGGDVAGGSCSNCLTAITGAIPGAAFGFDALSLDETITALDQPFTIDTITISYQLRDLAVGGIPEPTTWAFMILGFGGVASAMRARRRTAVLVA